MPEIITYLVVAGSISSLLILWFARVRKVLTGKKESVLLAAEQVELHLRGCEKARGSPDEQSAQRMMEIVREIYTQIERSYHETLKKPANRIPGYLMGFREFRK
ncbi:MAG: hypothetical protein GX193_01315 [Clostridiales bacterium]|nr:hypothetical protein [Clostridiales bacterium]